MEKNEAHQKQSHFSTALSAFADPYRRQLLIALIEHNPQDDDDYDPLDVLTEGAEPEVLEIQVVHIHLPKLAEMGYITWNRTTNEISKGPNWEEIAPLVELIDNHRDELPEGWL